MKKIILLPLLMVAFVLTSCNKESDDKGNYPDFVAYATTFVVGEGFLKPVADTDDKDDDDDTTEDKEYYYKLDNGDKLLLADDSRLVTYKPEAGERIIIYYSIIEDAPESDEFDASISLYGVNKVLVSDTAIVTTEEESLDIADHALEYIFENLSISGGFINIVAGYRADSPSKVKICVVKNDFEEADQTKDDYLNLELRYDRAGDEAIGGTYEQYMSLDLNSFANELEGMKGVILRTKTRKSGTRYVTIDIEKEDLPTPPQLS